MLNAVGPALPDIFADLAVFACPACTFFSNAPSLAQSLSRLG
jgi:hypothetical protein